jgi:hypothetical protein
LNDGDEDDEDDEEDEEDDGTHSAAPSPGRRSMPLLLLPWALLLSSLVSEAFSVEGTAANLSILEAAMTDLTAPLLHLTLTAASPSMMPLPSADALARRALRICSATE